DFAFPGETPVCKQYRSLPSAPAHCFVWLCIAQPYKAVCLVKHTHSPHSETAHS
ncbi:unnamed protein product, partial [Staurois parvus]